MRPTILPLFVLLLLAFAPFVAGTGLSISGQNGNTISGVVYGLDRRPLSDVYVELLDDLYRSVGQTRTDGLGSYAFSGVGNGNITVRVRPFLSLYQEQEVSLEIRNAFTITGTGGFSAYQQDIYLKLRKGVNPTAAAIFVQDVPSEAAKLYETAITHLRSNRTETALAHLRAAIALFPKYFAALELLATEYVKSGRPEAIRAAEILYRVAVNVNPRAYQSYYGLAYTLYLMEQYSEALAAAKEAIDLNATSFDTLLLYGVLLRRVKRFEEAERQLIKARDLSNSTPRAHWELALLYGNDLKRFADAARELKMYLKTQPDSRDTAHIKKLIAEFEIKSKGGR